MLAQYKAGLAKFEEASASQSAAAAVEEKQAIEDELKGHERILRKLRVSEAQLGCSVLVDSFTERPSRYDRSALRRRLRTRPWLAPS